MASSSSSNPSSTSSSSSTTSTPSAARVRPTRAHAPAASAALGVAPGANASAPNFAPDATASATSASATAPGFASGAIASASALNVAPGATASASAHLYAPGAIASTYATALNLAPSATAPRVSPQQTAWGGSKRVPPPTNFNLLYQRGRGDRARNYAGVSQERGRQSAADPTSTFAPPRFSSEGSSPATFTSAWTKPISWQSTVAPTDSRPASTTSSALASSSSTQGWESAADPTSTFAPSRLSIDIEGSSRSTSAWSKHLHSSSTTPSSDITLVPKASGSAHTAATSVDTAPEPDASTSSAPGVTTIADIALTSASSSAPGVATMIVDAALEPDAPASATTSTPGAAPATPSLRDNWVAVHWGIVPRSVEHCPGQEAFGGNGMPPVEVLNPDPLCPWREQVPLPRRSVGGPLCWLCRIRPKRVEARPCGHLAICVRCYCDCYATSNRLVCLLCNFPFTWLLQG